MDYPAGLPAPLRAGYNMNPENNIIRTQMVSGRARQRVAYTSIPAYADLSWIFTALQAMVFESFIAAAGGDWFMISIKSPIGYIPQECRFIETPQGPQLVGVNLWSYKAKAELREKPSLDSSYALYYPSIILQLDIFDRAMNEAWPQ